MGHSTVSREVYVVTSGSGRVKLDDEIIELREWDVLRVAPEVIGPSRVARGSRVRRRRQLQARGGTAFPFRTGGQD